jgi:hypothetical protein
MKIKFIKDCSIAIYVDGSDIIPPEIEKVNKGNLYETIHVIPIFKDISEVQFGNGDISFIDVDLFEIIEE